MKQHSNLGASSMYRWENCPASARLAARFPLESSDFAQEGTKAHDVAEWCLRNMHWNSAAYRKVHTEPLPDDMLDAVQEYLDAVWAAVNEAPRTELEIEKRFCIKHLGNDLFGTNDAMVYNPDKKKLTVFDYKHGAGVGVEVENNSQLLYYALGAAYTKHNYPLDSVELVVVQPRFDHREGSVRRWPFKPADLFEFEARLAAAAERARDPEAEFNPGPWCQFCPAAGRCIAQSERIFDVLRRGGWQIDIDKGVVMKPAKETYDAEELALLFGASGDIRTWLNRLSDTAEFEAKTNGLPGFKFIAGRKSRSWADEKAAAEVIGEALNDFNAAYTRSLVSPAQAEKLLKKQAPDTLDVLDRLVAVSEGRPRLVEDSHKSPAITVGAEADFEVLQDQE